MPHERPATDREHRVCAAAGEAWNALCDRDLTCEEALVAIGIMLSAVLLKAPEGERIRLARLFAEKFGHEARESLN